MKKPLRAANGRECGQGNYRSTTSNRFNQLQNLEEGYLKPDPRTNLFSENNSRSKIKNPRRSVQTQSAPKASLRKGKTTLLPPKPLTTRSSSIRDPNSNLVNILEITKNMVKRIQQSCKAFGVFVRWQGLGISSEAIADWFMSSFNWIVSIAIMFEGFLYIDCGNSRHKKELLTSKSPTFKGFDFCFLDWIPNFNPNNMQSLKIDRLVLIPNLPVELMDIEIIRKIGNHIGKFVEINDKYRKYANCVMIINMDISVKTLKPIEIKSGVSSFLIYPEFFKGILNLDPSSTPVLPPSQLRSSRIPGVDISFNLEKGGFVDEEIPLLSRHIEETKDVEDIEEGEFIINKGQVPQSPILIHDNLAKFANRRPIIQRNFNFLMWWFNVKIPPYSHWLAIYLQDEGLNRDMIAKMENMKSSYSPKGSPSDQAEARGKGPAF
ncbi:hypothetical protein SUGI_1057870 [Cryptomeria japonica]|nr:hypothetical protein SUGI_1057870 [Cryptomeria japonica]